MAVIKSGYLGSWQLESGVDNIDTTLYTHVYYAFAIPKTASYELNLTDDSSPYRLSYFTKTLRTKNPNIKLLLSIGGGKLPDNNVFADMASNEGHRLTFINSAIRAARDNGFDGLDLDWEFPKNVNEMKDYELLLNELRASITSEASTKSRTELLFVAAVRYTPFIDYDKDFIRTYPVATMAKTLDWINVMAYDHHGDWDNVTGAHTDIAITKGGIQKWIQEGMPKEKLVLGLAMYGVTWNLTNRNVNGIGAPGVAPRDSANEPDNLIPYSDILKFIYIQGDRQWCNMKNHGQFMHMVMENG